MAMKADFQQLEKELKAYGNDYKNQEIPINIKQGIYVITIVRDNDRSW